MCIRALSSSSALRRLALAFSVVVLATVGCGDDLNVVPVSGRITVDGKPFAGAHINTQPVASDMENPNPGPGSFGTTDTDGRYTLELATPSEPGAVVGKHRVTIIMEKDAHTDNPADDRYHPPSVQLPPWFGDGKSIFIEVPEGGTDSANLELSTKAPPG